MLEPLCELSTFGVGALRTEKRREDNGVNGAVIVNVYVAVYVNVYAIVYGNVHA